MSIVLNGTTGITTPDLDTDGLTSNGIDDNATSTAMTLDASGNLLLGTTGTNWTTTAGLYAFNQSALNVTRNGAESMNLNRLSSAGDIIKLYKSGSAVGSIGAFGNSGVYIAAPTSGGSALIFNDNAPILYPAKNNSGTIAVADNAIDLGASGVRFKDLYLSGGVYLGGTGAANKLDDYEEGTWTPVDGSTANLTFTSNTGVYTKTGRLVICSYRLFYPTTSNTASAIVSGLPFTSGAGFPTGYNGYNTCGVPISHRLTSTGQKFFVSNASSGATLNNSTLSGKEIQGTFIYHAS